MKENLSRKKFITQSLGYAGILFGGALFAESCNSDGDSKPSDAANATGDKPKSMVQPENCNDVTGISTEEVEKRKSLGYVESAPSPDVRCDVCKLYLPPAEGDKCGTCSLFKGFVDVAASCTYFAPLDA